MVLLNNAVTKLEFCSRMPFATVTATTVIVIATATATATAAIGRPIMIMLTRMRILVRMLVRSSFSS